MMSGKSSKGVEEINKDHLKFQVITTTILQLNVYFRKILKTHAVNLLQLKTKLTVTGML